MIPLDRGRRRLLLSAASATAAAALSRSAHALGLWQQTPAAGHPQTSDEMTANTQQQRQHYPPPDFGPPPSALPSEAIAVSGRNSLRQHAGRRHLVYGAAMVVRELMADPVLQQLVADQCGVVVPSSELKWVALRPSQDRFDFSRADALVAFAQQHKLLVRGHTFVWHNSVPEWLQKAPSTLDVRQLLVEHIRTVAGHYRGRMQSWDVVNEAILPKDGLPGGLRNSFWCQHIGPDYIDLAFRTAREADPHAKLTYNDYGVEHDNDEEAERRRCVLELLRGMKARGVPLDAVGIQSHIKAASASPIGQGLTDYMKTIQDMGLEIYLTELDVNEDDIPSNDVAERDRIIAETYSQFLHFALANPAVRLVLTWGLSDRNTWLNDGPTHHRKQPNRPQRSLPFDPGYRPAPAFFAVRDSFDARNLS